jgi:hypothetical protein
MFSNRLERPWLRPRPIRGIQDRISEYAAMMTPGGVEASNFIAMCEVASGDGERSVKCRACSGLGFKKGDALKVEQWERELRKEGTTDARRDALREKLRDESICRPCAGTGFRTAHAKREEHDGTWTTVRCELCRGCGEVRNEEDQDVCPRCQGDMCVVPVTVKRRGSSKKGRLPPGATAMTDSDGNPTPGGIWSSEELEAAPEYDEVRLAENTKTEALIRSLDAETLEALKAWEGPDGAKWAPTKWGRAFALWPMTEAGKRLFDRAARRSRLRSGYLRRPIDVLTEEREAESRAEEPDIERRILLGEADKQARVIADRLRARLEQAEAAQ